MKGVLLFSFHGRGITDVFIQTIHFKRFLNALLAEWSLSLACSVRDTFTASTGVPLS